MAKKIFTDESLAAFVNETKSYININIDAIEDQLSEYNSIMTSHIDDEIHLIDGDRDVIDSNLITADVMNTIQIYSVTITGKNIGNVTNQNTVVVSGSSYINTVHSSKGLNYYNVKMGGITLIDEAKNDQFTLAINIPIVTGDIEIYAEFNSVSEPT